MSEIVNWYSGQNILITGVTGFLGKVVLEKILREFKNIGTVYIFVRPKKGKTPNERKDIILKAPIFDSIRENNASQFVKITTIEAGLSAKGLGLTECDEKEIINNCNIVIHCAADVHFDTSIHEIIGSNVYGLNFMLKLAKKIKNLTSFVYCSTAFLQPYGIDVTEEYQKPPLDSEILDKILQKYDQHTTNILTKKILGKLDNTYALSKIIAEHTVKKYEGIFPIAIARPVIVTSAAYEPMPGWTEGYNGLNGWAYAGMRGVVKTTYCNGTCPRGIIPVDVTSNALIIIAWQLGIMRTQKIIYYNLAEKLEDRTSWNVEFNKAIKYSADYPLDFTVLHTGGSLKTSKFINLIYQIWYQFIPAILIDFILVALRKKPILIKVQNKIINGFAMVEYYITNTFLFQADNFYDLKNKLNDVDNKKFNIDIKKSLRYPYYKNFALGVKLYLAKETLKNLSRAKRTQQIQFAVGKIIQIILFLLFLKYFWNNWF